MTEPRRMDEAKDKDLIQTWMDRARAVKNSDELKAFVDELNTAYHHDYGTIVHAIVAAGIAGAYAVERGPQGGITGFQAGFVTWGLIREWSENKSAKKMLHYDDLLYPQTLYKFEKTLDKHIWTELQEKAKKLIDEHKETQDDMSSSVFHHWKKIAGGELPPGFTLE